MDDIVVAERETEQPVPESPTDTCDFGVGVSISLRNPGRSTH